MEHQRETHHWKILIVKLGAVGDCVHALYALGALRQKYPDATIGWAVEEKSSQIVLGQPALDEVHVISRKKGWMKWLADAKDVRRVRYDTAVDLSNLLKSGWVTRRSGARLRIGFDRWREGNFLFTNRRIRSRKGHMIERYHNLLAPLEVGDLPPKVQIVVPEFKQIKMNAFVKDELGGGDPIVALNPHASWPDKRYPPDRYGVVADKLAESGARVLLLWGGKSEFQAVKELAGSMISQPVIAPPADLQELYHLLSLCTIYLGNDTGPMHMAAAAGIGVVGLFGPTDPERVGPWTDKKRIVTAPEECKDWPCENRKCDHADCIALIPRSRVRDAALSMIGECC